MDLGAFDSRSADDVRKRDGLLDTTMHNTLPKRD